MVVFFVPYGLMTAELGAAWPGEGGLYVWVREALGPRWGSTARLVLLDQQRLLDPLRLHGLRGHLPHDVPAYQRQSTWVQAGIAIALTWLTVGSACVRLEVSKWIPNLGAVVKVAIFLGLGGARGRRRAPGARPPPTTSASRSSCRTGATSLAFLPVLLYNTLGFELMSSAGDEMRDPQRDVPRVILLSGAVICVVYTLGALGILLAVPLEDLSLVTGTYDALGVLGKPWGAAGERSSAPRARLPLRLRREHRHVEPGRQPRGRRRGRGGRRCRRRWAGSIRASRRPTLAFVIMGARLHALLLGNAALSASATNVFWMIFKLSGLCFLISYLMVFPSFVILRRKRPTSRGLTACRAGSSRPGPAPSSAGCSCSGACLLFFEPVTGAPRIPCARRGCSPPRPRHAGRGPAAHSRTAPDLNQGQSRLFEAALRG